MIDGDLGIGGNDWQKYVDELLQCHHKGEYQRVPAANGDCGMEGYTHAGDGYQSYSDQESKTHAQRTEKQRDKITRDIKKLEKNKAFWTTIFASAKLRRWYLVVPNFDEKKLLQHAAKKRDEVKKRKLAFIASDFEIDIRTHRDFPIARTLLENPMLACNTVIAHPATPEQLNDLRSTQPTFVSNIDMKLKKAIPGSSKTAQANATKDFLNWHLKCANYLEDLRSKFPTLWEQIDELGAVMADSLETEKLFDKTVANQRLSSVKERLEKALAEKAPFAKGGKLVILSWAIARWLGECPLDFVGGKNGG